MLPKFRRRLNAILETHDLHDPVGVTLNVFLFTLIVLNVAAVILGSFRDLATLYSGWFDAFEVFSVAFFTVEYAARLWTAPERLGHRWPHARYAVSLGALIDLAAIAPFYLPLLLPLDLRFLRILRLLRLVRVFKLTRYVASFQVVERVFKRERGALFTSFFFLVLLLLIASCLVFAAENEAQPDKFPNIVETLWWAVVTLTTVGYGDVYPITALGKVLSGLISILGIGVVALPTAIISSGFIAELQKGKKTRTHRRFRRPVMQTGGGRPRRSAGFRPGSPG